VLLKKGDNNEFVYGLQQILNKLGYNCNLDGNFDLKTYNALIKFQLNHKMKITGIFDKKV
jgi:peptidoglycan hydrolase-like protein with peptidoglycan-binding domain